MKTKAAPDTENESARNHALQAWLGAIHRDAHWTDVARGLLCELLEVDTTPKPDRGACAAAEDACLAVVERWLASAAPRARAARRPIRPEIAAHPYYSRPYYLAGLPAEPADAARAAYAGRSNLMARLDGRGHGRLAFNAHIDTVPPHIAPRVENGVVHGRGSADDKGGVAAIILAAALLEHARERFGAVTPCDLLLQVVIDEETGGNGSLSLAHEPDNEFDAIVVLECTGLKAHPANRGAVWYRAELAAGAPGADLLGAAAFAIGAMEAEGRRIRAESAHPMFPTRPVQTCHGIFGHHGSHPSRLHDHVALRLRWEGVPHSHLVREVDAALGGYTAAYGDKTVPGAGDALLARHLGWRAVKADSAVLDVHGLAGHMGATERLDGAITKAAWIIRHLVEVRTARGGAWGSLRVELEAGTPAPLVLEGGQGFLPTHGLDEVTGRLSRAVHAGVAGFLALTGATDSAVTARVDFDKLHNAAFARHADCAAMRAIGGAMERAGIGRPGSVTGWTVSCDARIFALSHPRADVVTFGPGELGVAHSGDEHVHLADVLRAAQTLAFMALDFGGDAADTTGSRETS